MLKVLSWSLRNTDLTQSTDWTWSIHRHQTFRSWGSLFPNSLPCREWVNMFSCALLPTLTSNAQRPMAGQGSPASATTSAVQRGKRKKGPCSQPGWSLLLLSLYWILLRPKRPLASRTCLILIFSLLFFSYKLNLIILSCIFRNPFPHFSQGAYWLACLQLSFLSLRPPQNFRTVTNNPLLIFKYVKDYEINMSNRAGKSK